MMGMDVTAILRRGFDRSITRRGRWLMAAFLVIDTVFLTIPAAELNMAESVSNAFVLGIFSIIGAILSLVIVGVMIRIFVDRDPTKPVQSYLEEGLGWITLNLFVGGVITTILIGLGMVLILPGFYLLVSLLFWPVIVVVDEADFIDAIRKSWEMTRGQKWRLFLLVIGILVVSLIVILVGTLIGAALPGIIIPSIAVGICNAFSMVFTTAVIVEAYRDITR